MVYGFVTNRTKIVIELIYRVFFTSVKQLLIEFVFHVGVDTITTKLHSAESELLDST